MNGRRGPAKVIWAAVVAMTLSTIGVALAQQEKTAPAPAAKTKAAPKGKPTSRKAGLRAPGGPGPKAARKPADDPLAKPAGATDAAVEAGTYHYEFKLLAAEGSPSSALLAAKYYPSRLGTGAAVVLLVHEKDRSGQDFEEPIADLKNLSLAEHLQKQGIASLILDLRGQGANPRRQLSERDWRAMALDIQSAYYFLIDRHNRGELNLARLGVVGVGEGANLSLHWASMQGAAVASQGRTSDLSSLALVSPMIDAQSQGLRALKAITVLAPRVPIGLFVGDKDEASIDLVKAAQPVVKRHRANRVELKATSLHGYKLLKLEPEFTDVLLRFIEETTRAKPEEWEPRYNLAPVAYQDVKLVPNPSRDGRATDSAAKKAHAPAEKKADAPAEKKAEEKKKAEPSAKKAEP